MNLFKKVYYAFTSVRFGKISKLFIALTFLFLLLAILENYEIWVFKLRINPFSKDGYFWFHSTIAQSMAALFGMGGMFAAYIFQRINSKIKDRYSEGRRLASGVSSLIDLSDDEFSARLKDHIKSPEAFQVDKSGLNRLKKADKIIESMKDFKLLLIVTFRTVIIFMTSVILLSLIALPFSHYLSKLTFGFTFVIFLLILTIASILKMVRFIQAAIDG